MLHAEIINMCEQAGTVCVHAPTLEFSPEHHHAQKQSLSLCFLYILTLYELTE